MATRKARYWILLSLILALGAGLARWWQQRPPEPHQQARAMLEQVLGPYGRVTFVDAMHNSDHHLLITDVRYDLQHTPWRYQAKQLLVRQLDRRHDLPDVLDVSVKDLRIGRQDGLPATFLFDLQRLGLQQSQWNVDLSYVFHRNTTLLQLQGELELTGAGSLGFRARLDQVDKDAILFAWPTATVKELHLRYQDHGLQDALLKASATESGITLDEFKARLQETLQRYEQSSAEPRQQANFLALRQWLHNGGNLQLSMQPQRPVSLLEITGLPPERLAARLELHIEHQP